MKKHIYTKILITTTACLVFFIGTVTHAATLTLKTNAPTVSKDSLVTVTVLLDAESVPINTIEGDLVYNPQKMLPEKVSIGSSFISFWVEKPMVTSTGKMHFSGIVPGGVSTSNAEVFNITFKLNELGSQSVNLENVHLYINDSNGTEDKVKLLPASFVVDDTVPVATEKPVDTKSPEDFKIVRTSDMSIEDGKYFIVFSTQDKGGGVDHYSVCEMFTSCVVSDSPYVLKKQNVFYYIKVMSYDADGNVTTSTLVSPYLLVLTAVFILGLLYLLIKLKFILRNK